MHFSCSRSASPFQDALRTFHSDEDGGAYTLSYVMVIPFLMMLIALIAESALMMSAKIGTHYAAYAAVRSASVSNSTRNWGEAVNLAEQAAQQAMLPFASGSTNNANASDAFDNLEAINAAHQDWINDPVAESYLKAKATDVSAHLAVELGSAPQAWDAEITATVTYQYPFRVPGLGPLIGERQGNNFVFPLKSKAVLHNESPQNANQNLGIGYGRPTN